MRSRCLLHKNHFDAFEEYLKKHGWIIEQTKGAYEYLRATYPGRKGCLLVYAKIDMKEHYTVFGESLNIAHRFIREMKEKKNAQVATGM